MQNYLLANTLMIHREMLWEMVAECGVSVENGQQPGFSLSPASSGKESGKWKLFMSWFLPLLCLPLFRELRQSWLQRLCWADLAAGLQVLSKFSGIEFTSHGNSGSPPISSLTEREAGDGGGAGGHRCLINAPLPKLPECFSSLTHSFP